MYTRDYNTYLPRGNFSDRLLRKTENDAYSFTFSHAWFITHSTQSASDIMAPKIVGRNLHFDGYIYVRSRASRGRVYWDCRLGQIKMYSGQINIEFGTKLLVSGKMYFGQMSFGTFVFRTILYSGELHSGKIHSGTFFFGQLYSGK